MICFKCGGEFRQVYRSGKIRDIDSTTDREHWRTCKGRGQNRQRVRALRKSRKGRHTAERINAEAIRGLRKALS